MILRSHMTNASAYDSVSYQRIPFEARNNMCKGPHSLIQEHVEHKWNTPVLGESLHSACISGFTFSFTETLLRM